MPPGFKSCVTQRNKRRGFRTRVEAIANASGSDGDRGESESSRSGKEFVAFDAGRHAAAAVVRLDAEHARVAADIYVAGECNLLREGEDEFDGAAGFQAGLDRE